MKIQADNSNMQLKQKTLINNHISFYWQSLLLKSQKKGWWSVKVKLTPQTMGHILILDNWVVKSNQVQKYAPDGGSTNKEPLPYIT